MEKPHPPPFYTSSLTSPLSDHHLTQGNPSHKVRFTHIVRDHFLCDPNFRCDVDYRQLRIDLALHGQIKHQLGIPCRSPLTLFRLTDISIRVLHPSCHSIGHLGMAASISAMRRMVSLRAVTTLQ